MSRLPFRKLAPGFFDRVSLADLMDPVAVAKRDDLTADLLDALTRDAHDVGVPRRDFWIRVIQKVRAHRLEHDERSGDGLVAAGHALGQRHHHDLKGRDATVRADGDFGIRIKFLAHDFFPSTSVLARIEARRWRRGDGAAA